ncbi:MAG TPA: methyltransferase domain-containing protein [Pyrinomonadaceae bacterium]|jgi:SAM-dependent methyltransferase|nr:methyltransferase domain-containing protein [Pyrinomonadaceae bacterium]
MAEANAAFIGTIPENYDRYLGPVLFEPYAADLASRLEVAAGAAVLELACGTGRVTRLLYDRIGPQGRLVATDLNEAMLNYARQKFGAEGSIEWKQADAAELPFADQSFDAVVCQFGLMFFPEKEKALREVFRVLKPGGKFLFNVWDEIKHNDLPYVTQEIIVNFFADNPPDFYQVPFSLYDPKEIRLRLSGAGFGNIELTLLPLAAIASSAPDVAKGLIQGNPIINSIRQRDEAKAPEIEATLAFTIARKFGESPVRAKMQALVCTAIR